MTDIIETKLRDPVKTACPECPFNRNVRPGALGGSPTTTYVGQVYGPFNIACHMHVDFTDSKWKTPEAYTKVPQCAGAAIMRANIGLVLPEILMKLPADKEIVFADIHEFIAHHTGIDIENVRKLCPDGVIAECVSQQMAKALWAVPHPREDKK